MKKRIQSKKASLQDWHPADIVAAVRKAGWSLRRLSIHHGYHPNTLKHALVKPYANGEHLIAEAIGIAPKVIWPSRYQEPRPRFGIGGAPTHKTGRKAKLNDTTNLDSCNGNPEGGNRQ